MPAAELSAPDGLEPSPEVAAYRDEMDERTLAEGQRRSALEATADSTGRRLLQVQLESAMDELERMGDQSRHTLDAQAWREVRGEIASLQAEVLRLRRELQVVNAAHAAESASAQGEIMCLRDLVQAKDGELTAVEEGAHDEIDRQGRELQAAKSASLACEFERQLGASVTHAAELASAQGKIVCLQMEIVRRQDEIQRIQRSVATAGQATVDRATVDVSTAQSKALAQAMEHIKQLEARLAQAMGHNKQLEARANCSDADRDARATQPLRARCEVMTMEYAQAKKQLREEEQLRIRVEAKAAAELQAMDAKIAALERASTEAEDARRKLDAQLCEAPRTIQEQAAAAAAPMADAVLVPPPSPPASSSSSSGFNVAALPATPATRFGAFGGAVLAPSPLDFAQQDRQRVMELMLAVAAEDEAKVRELVQVYGVNPHAANHGFCGRYTGMSPYDLAYSKSSGMFTSVYNRMLAIMDGKQ